MEGEGARGESRRGCGRRRGKRVRLGHGAEHANRSELGHGLGWIRWRRGLMAKVLKRAEVAKRAKGGSLLRLSCRFGLDI